MQTISQTSTRRRQNIWLDENARNIADLALATCEEKLAETRRRKRPNANHKKAGYSRGAADNNNPYLARLGSQLVISRSMKGKNTMVNVDNVHPLKDTRSMSKRSRMAAEGKDNHEEDSSGWWKLRRKLSILDAPTYTLLVLFLTLIVLPRSFLVAKDRLLKWHALRDRHLSGRRCVMNVFVDKQKEDEWNPDWYDKKKDKTRRPDDHILEDTYRTKGQMKLITRFIGCVADSFRTDLRSIQHIVFTGSRDGGHLAQEAGLYWPPRGTIRARLHIFAGDESNSTATLEYDNLDAMEKRFDAYDDFIFLYDHNGNMAGIIEEEQPEDADDDEFEPRKKRVPGKNLDEVGYEDILWDPNSEEEEEDDEEDEGEDGENYRRRKNIIPYFHVDGDTFEKQLSILEKARPLLESNGIAVLGLEHSRDLDINRLIEFFLSVRYKTFMLGLRQLTRLDNLCPEALENILDHPMFTKHSLLSMFDKKKPGNPPFFIALPKGRHSLEEMTIQTMYDLFSGAGGGGQVKTANDRKKPGA